MTERNSQFWMLALVAALGAAFCWVWAGPGVLDPMSVGWLQQGDRAMHTLGWWFFRDAPWGWPPGVSPKLGLELSSSVALSDSLPLFAMPLKFVAAWLPERFQYWGLWYLLSFGLQAVFGYLIAREFRLSTPVAVLAALFCLIQPAFLDRIGGHMALGGHWTVLAAIYLYVRRSPPPIYTWPLLLAAVSAIHGYLLAMCFGIWVAAVVQRLWLGGPSRWRLLPEAVLAFVLIAVVLWATGTLMVSSLQSGGYGIFRMNLLSVFDAGGWSRIWPDLPQKGGDYEGMNFPGLGIALLAIMVLVAGPRIQWRVALQARWLPLLVLGIGLTLFAISNHIGFGAGTLVGIPLPEPIAKLASIFRSSGRMFWPVGYLILFAVLVRGNRLMGGWVVPALAILLTVQALDSSIRWAGFRGVGELGPKWANQLPDPAWEALGERYANIRGVPVKTQHKRWLELSYFALQHDMGTDAAYLGRIDATAFDRRVAAAETEVTTGAVEPDAIYVLDLWSALKLAPHAGPADLMTRLDGLIVFAKDGATVLGEKGIVAERFVPDLIPLAAQVPLAIDRTVAENYLLAGWSGVEDWGLWSEGPQAVIAFKSPIAGSSHLRLSMSGIPPRKNAPQEVDVSVNGGPVTHLSLGPKARDVDIALPDGAPRGNITVVFDIAEPTKPSARTGTGDIRPLGIGLRSFELRPGPGQQTPAEGGS